MKFNTTAASSVIVLLSAFKTCSAVKDSATGEKVKAAELETVAQDILSSPESGSEKYILSEKEAQAISQVTVRNLETLLAALVDLEEEEEEEDPSHPSHESSQNLILRSQAFVKVFSKFDNFKIIYNKEVVGALKLIIEYQKISKTGKLANRKIESILKNTNNAKAKADLISEQNTLIQEILEILEILKRKGTKESSHRLNDVLNHHTELISLLLEIEGPTTENILQVLIDKELIDREIRKSSPELFKISHFSNIVFGNNPRQLEIFASIILDSIDILKDIVLICETTTLNEVLMVTEISKWGPVKDIATFPEMVQTVLSGNKQEILDLFERLRTNRIVALAKFLKNPPKKVKVTDKLLIEQFKFLNGNCKAANNLISAITPKEKGGEKLVVSWKEVREILEANGIIIDISPLLEDKVVVEEEKITNADSGPTDLGGTIDSVSDDDGGSGVDSVDDDDSRAQSSDDANIVKRDSSDDSVSVDDGGSGVDSDSEDENLQRALEMSLETCGGDSRAQSPDDANTGVAGPNRTSHFNDYKYFYVAAFASVCICGGVFMFKDQIFGSDRTKL